MRMLSVLEFLVPSAVQDLSAFPLSHREIGVIWKPPKEINGFLLGYNLSHCPVTQDPKEDAYLVDSAACQYMSLSTSTVYDRIHQLKAETSYRIEVHGYTAAGAGDLNSIDVKTLPENVNRDDDSTSCNKRLEEFAHQLRRILSDIDTGSCALSGSGILRLPSPVALSVHVVCIRPYGSLDDPHLPPVAPAEPSLAEAGIGVDHLNVTWVPGTYDPDSPTPVGDRFYFKYRPKVTCVHCLPGSLECEPFFDYLHVFAQFIPIQCQEDIATIEKDMDSGRTVIYSFHCACERSSMVTY
ncbi:unnamed protein product [Soboliphyme baturini]|uniref:Fibronectin type-III domain-containing protein n=1 Tax=Soboliphyme baturini TaxID=241478 RepID=A0A183J0B5_9BILA|nr:unnamed protein product [Soboliphyme baturini]